MVRGGCLGAGRFSFLNARSTCSAWLARAAILAAALAAGCGLFSDPVRIGFSGPLTGPWSDLGVQGRNGATLAVEELNAAGGITGREVELLVEDEGRIRETVLAAIQALDSRGAAAVVGLMTSSAALAGAPEAAARGLAVVSPTATTAELAGQPDTFFRVIPDLRVFARALAGHMVLRDGARVALLVLDQGNPAFSGPYAAAFTARFTELGGRVAGATGFPVGAPPDRRDLARRAAELGADALVAVLPARDLANLVLGLRSRGQGPRIYSSVWGFTPEFLEMAGQAAEGVASCTTYPFDDFSLEVSSFNDRYRKRFGDTPSFGAALAYEAVQAAAAALARTGGRRQGLVAALNSLGPRPGVLGPLAFDANGDVQRRTYMSEVRDGRIRTLEAVGE